MNGWTEMDVVHKGQRLKARGEADQMLGMLTESVYREMGAYDAGFEAGVLATEAGVGRADE